MAKKRSKDLSKGSGDKAADTGAPDSDKGRVLATLALAAALGVAGGALVVGRLPVRELVPSARAATAFAQGDGAALAEAATGDRGSPEEVARGALADALLMFDFAGGAEHRERLGGLASADPAARKLPEALYARALLARTGAADPELDADIAAAGGGSGEANAADRPEGDGEQPNKGKDGEQQPSERDSAGGAETPSATLLARAARLIDAHRLDDAWVAARQAALRPDAPVYALCAAARVALARGQPAEARVLLERGLERAPKHGALLALLVVAGAFDGRASDHARDQGDEDPPAKETKDGGKPAGSGDDGPAKQTAKRGPPVSAAETRASRAISDLSPRDAAVVAFTLQALALARGDTSSAGTHAKRVLAAAPTSAALAARQAELSLLLGDLAAADDLVTTSLKAAAADPDLLLARSRVRAMAALPPEALRPDARADAVNGAVLALPLGHLALDATAPALPWRVELDETVSPDTWLRAERAARKGDLEGRLGVVENVWAAEYALRRGDVPVAATAAAAARAKAPDNVDALLVDARVRLLKGDRDGMRAALKAAHAAGADDARVPLTATRIAYDAEDLALTRSYLAELGRLGFKSPAALALTAVVTAREGDPRGAQAAIKEAETLSPDDLDVLRGRLVLARLAGNLAEVRKHADRVLAVDDARSPDPLLRAWEGEALFRKGEGERAQAVLRSVLAARPGLVDAHLALGIALAGPRPLDAAASFAQAIQIGGDAAIVAEATKRRAAIADAPPLK